MSSATEYESPAATDTMFSSTPFPSGDFTCCFCNVVPDVVPFPNCPYPLYPQVHTCPSVSTAIACVVPNPICTMLVVPVYVGKILFDVSPVPNCPYPLYP